MLPRLIQQLFQTSFLTLWKIKKGERSLRGDYTICPNRNIFSHTGQYSLHRKKNILHDQGWDGYHWNSTNDQTNDSEWFRSSLEPGSNFITFSSGSLSSLSGIAAEWSFGPLFPISGAFGESSATCRKPLPLCRLSSRRFSFPTKNKESPDNIIKAPNK